MLKWESDLDSLYIWFCSTCVLYDNQSDTIHLNITERLMYFSDSNPKVKHNRCTNYKQTDDFKVHIFLNYDDLPVTAKMTLKKHFKDKCSVGLDSQEGVKYF